MSNIDKILVPIETSILTVISVIDQSAYQIALVINSQRQLIGTITDGDIRRGLLKGVSVQDSVEKIMNFHPTVVPQEFPKRDILNLLVEKKLRQIPVLDQERRVVRVEVLEELSKAPLERTNSVVIMAGGQGIRLRPLTENTPKPLLSIGNKPILETILETLIQYGFRNFYFSVHYKAEMIEEYFGDGAKWNINIQYLKEQTPLGTAGALSLVSPPPIEPILVMNADLLTRVNFDHLLAFHLEHQSEATLCVREYDFQIPYGVVTTEKENVLNIQEKPIKRYFVNAGIYVLDPKVFSCIHSDTYLDMPSLMNSLLGSKKKISAFPIHEYWLDIGQMGDFNKAQGDFLNFFS